MSDAKSVIEIDHTDDTFADIINAKPDEKIHDIIFKVDGQVFRANKVILACRSPYWNQQFKTDQKVNWEIKGVKADAFKAILEYIYTGQIQLDKDSCLEWILGITELAAKYKLRRLLEQIVCLLELTPESLWQFYSISKTYKAKDLRKKCFRFMDSCSEDILKSAEFFCLTAEEATKVIQNDTFYADELDLLKACKTWMLTNGFKALNKFLATVRFSNVKDTERDEALRVLKDLDVENPESYLDRSPYNPTLNPRVCVKRNCPVSLNLRFIKFIQGKDSSKDIVVKAQPDGTLPDLEKLKERRSMLYAYSECKIQFELKHVCRIDHLLMYLKNECSLEDEIRVGHSGLFCYSVEGSKCSKSWTLFADRRMDGCQGYQSIFFEACDIKYLRLRGYNWFNRGKNYFWSWVDLILDNWSLIQEIQAWNKNEVGNIENGILIPTYNVASEAEGATVYVASSIDYWSYLLSDNSLAKKYERPCTLRFISKAQDNFIEIVLAQQYMIDTIKILFYDRDNNTTYDFAVYISANHSDSSFDLQTSIKDKNPKTSNNWRKIDSRDRSTSWQTTKFQLQIVAAICIECLNVRNHLPHKEFRIVEVECYAG